MTTLNSWASGQTAPGSCEMEGIVRQPFILWRTDDDLPTSGLVGLSLLGVCLLYTLYSKLFDWLFPLKQPSSVAQRRQEETGEQRKVRVRVSGCFRGYG